MERPGGKFPQRESGLCSIPGERGMWDRMENTALPPRLYLGLTLPSVQLRICGNNFVY